MTVDSAGMADGGGMADGDGMADNAGMADGDGAKNGPVDVPRRSMKRRLSTLIMLVSFVFAILFVSVAASSMILHFLIEAGVLPSLLVGGRTFFFLFLLLVSLFTGTVMAVLAGDRFLRPLRSLTAATKAIASGDFSVRVESCRARELDQLTNSFNEMAKELASVESLRSDFLSDISHEFKTPIASIRGFAKRLKKGSLADEKRSEYLDIIISESERLSKLSENILLLTKLENTGIITDRTACSLDEQLRRSLLLLEPQLQKKRLALDASLGPARIVANEEMLRHLWINLLGNAVKFSPVGGTIGITLRLEGEDAVISISDAGSGMDEDMKKHIFEKFYQGDRSRATEGNGLGLPLVKRILELEGGSIAVDSEPGLGACFTVRLPTRRPPDVR